MSIGNWLSHLRHIVPPEEGAPEVVRWRWLMFIATGICVIGVAGHILAAKNLIPGVTGYAHAGEMQQVRDTLQAMQLRTLEQLLFTTREWQCKAIKVRNIEAMRAAAEKIHRLMIEYRAMTGTSWDGPSCEELM